MDLLTACRDERLFAPWFKDPATWSNWFVFIAAAFGLGFATDPEIEIYTRCTGRTAPTAGQASEAWITAGRRSGKSFVLALVATYLATFRDWRPHLSPGEIATIVVIACDRRQARVIMRYLSAFLEECSLLKPMVVRQTRGDGMTEGWSVALDNRVIIEVHAASFRRIRGYTIVAALLDEIAFWRSDEGSANPDREVLRRFGRVWRRCRDRCFWRRVRRTAGAGFCGMFTVGTGARRARFWCGRRRP